MPEAEGPPPQPEPPRPETPAMAPDVPDAPDAQPPPPGPWYLPFGAYALPSALAAPRPTWARAYALPSARQVVYAGLQLAQGSSPALRRASVYIGLLALGAFGPAAILFLVGLGRLLSDPATAATLTGDNPFLLFAEQPGIGGPLALIYAVAAAGFILLIAISIDAEAMAIAILAANAAERPIRLDEAVRRARQAFWRLFFSGLLVGLGANVLAFVISLPFLRPFDSNEGVSFIASMIATLVFTPFAFAATGIVLGDAGAIETLRRSARLFRARPRIALVVTLFTLVTAAIQAFALGGGADLVFRVADFFHLGEGAASLILPGILVLAFIVAFGSLTFTIAAIVAAPQVAAFLGLTFYSGGLDLARAPDDGTAPRVRWVSIPMTIVIAGLAVVAVVGLPTITGFQPRPPSPLVSFLREAAAAHGQQVAALGPGGSSVDDPAHDTVGPGLGATSSDILLADVGWLPDVPDWLLDAFDCGLAGVACGSGERAGRTFSDGAFVFYERLAGSPEVLPSGRIGEWGPILTEAGSLRASGYRGLQYPGASHAYITRRTNGQNELVLVHYTNRAAFEEETTSARSRWVGTDLITLVPIAEIDDEDPSWDEYAGDRASSETSWNYDILRNDPTKPLLHLEIPSMFMTLPTLEP